MTKKERFDKVLDYFSRHMPQAETELHYHSPYQLIVAVILSAQCTDKRVNITTPAIFADFPDFESLANTDFETLQPYIKSISYPNNKTKHLINMARTVMADYNGELPSTREELMKLQGVGRKTANVLVSVLHDFPAMAVDTHVFRVSKRIGLTHNAKNPLQAEKQLIRYIPNEKIPLAHHWLILHGRYVCVARNPKCGECGLTQWCKYYEKNVKKGL